MINSSLKRSNKLYQGINLNTCLVYYEPVLNMQRRVYCLNCRCKYLIESYKHYNCLKCSTEIDKFAEDIIIPTEIKWITV